MTALFTTSQGFNRSAVMLRAHAKVSEERAEWPTLYRGQTYAQTFSTCLKAAWREARAERSRVEAGRTVEAQVRLTVLRNRRDAIEMGATRIDVVADQLRAIDAETSALMAA